MSMTTRIDTGHGHRDGFPPPEATVIPGRMPDPIDDPIDDDGIPPDDDGDDEVFDDDDDIDPNDDDADEDLAASLPWYAAPGRAVALDAVFYGLA